MTTFSTFVVILETAGKKATLLTQFKSNYKVSLYNTKKVSAFQPIRHEQHHPLPLPAGTAAARATVCSQERLMTMSLIENSA